MSLQRGIEANYRLIDWLPGELKYTEMHSEALLTVKVNVRLNCFFRIQMDVFHEPARLVGTDWENAECEGAKALTLLLEVRRIACISSKVDVSFARLYDKGTPKCSHLIEDASRRSVLALNKMYGGILDRRAVAPVEFDRLFVAD
jgi:hypothetical protein